MGRKGVLYKKLLYTFISLFTFVGNSNVFAQVDFGNLWVAGNNLQIIYNTLDQYQNGINLTAWTRVKATIKCESCLTTDTWEIRMFARTDALNYSGSEIGVSDINFNQFPIEVDIIGSVSGLTVNTPFILEEATPATSDGLILISGSHGMGLGSSDPPFEFEFTLSYSLPSMENKANENAMFFSVIDLLLISN